MGLNILMFSFDSTLTADDGALSGNAKSRVIEYARHLESLHIVVKTPQGVRRNAIRIKDNLFVHSTSSLNKYFFLFDAFKIASRICKENTINLITAQDPSITGLVGWLLKKKYGIPLIIQVTADIIDNEYFIKENPFNFFLNSLANLLIRKADALRVTTLKEKEKLERKVRNWQRVFYAPIFIDLEPFSKEQGNPSGLNIRHKYLGNKFNKLVLTVCRLVKQKGLQTLLKAISSARKVYPEALFLIVGSGREEEAVKSAIAQLDIEDNVRLVEEVDFSRLPEYFFSCDLFAISSLYEGTCAVILEAMAAGKPVVSTAHSGALDAVIDGETGFIVDFEDSEGLARKIAYFLKNEELARRMGEKGRESLLGRFDKDKILQDYLGIFEATVKKRL